MKQTGHNSFRTSIQWSRLIPDESGTINEEAVRFYHRYFDELIENGIEPFVNLYHFDMPMYLQEKGGWLNRETVEAYEKYAKSCFELFGSKVKNGLLIMNQSFQSKQVIYIDGIIQKSQI